MGSTIKIEVELDSSGAVKNTRQLKDELQKLGMTTGPLNTGLGAAKTQTRELSFEQMQASRAAEMLASRLGISLPEGARRFIVTLKGVAPALAAAFSASAVIAIGMALFEAGKRLYDWIAGTKEAEEATRKQKEAQEDLNRSMTEYIGKLKQAQKEGELAGLSGTGRLRQAALQKATELQGLLETKGMLQGRLGEIRPDKTYGFSQQQVERIAAIKKQIEALELPIAIANQELNNFRKQTDAAFGEEAQKNLDETNKRLEDSVKFWRQMRDEIEAARIAGLGDIGRAITGAQGDLSGFPTPSPYGGMAGIMSGARHLSGAWQYAAQLSGSSAEMAARLAGRMGDQTAVTQYEIAQLEIQKQLYSDNADAIAAIEERKKLLIMQNHLEIAEDAKAKFDRTASAIEGFFQRVFLSAKSFGDVWKQLWTQSVGWVVSQFARMVAGWLSAHRQMAASTGMNNAGIGAGGSLASIAGGLLSPGSLGGYNAAGGGGGYSGGGYDLDTILAGGGIGGTGGGGISGNPLFRPGGGLSTMGLVTSVGALGGMMLGQYGVNKGSPVLGGLGGFLGGGFAGMGIGAALMAQGHMWGAFLGPIGAGVGLVAGILLASRKRGQQKRASAAIHEEYLAVARKALDDYKAHKATYDSAVGGLTSVYQSAVQQLQGMGGPGRDTITQITANYQSVLSQMERVNQARGYRTTTIAGLPVPQFATGSAGIIPGSGPFAAVIHGGEAILNERAAAKLGSGKIKALNEGGSGGGDTFIIQAMDTRGFADFLKRNRATVIRMLRRERADGYI